MFCLEVITGRYAGATALLSSGDLRRVGAGAGSDLWLSADRFVEPSHCAISFERSGLRLYNLSRAGTYVNGAVADGVLLKHGDWLATGTTITLCLDSTQPKSDFDTVLTRLAAFLQNSVSAQFPIYFVGRIDATGPSSEFSLALPPEATTPILESRLALVRIPEPWSALAWFLRTVWGKGLGLFLRSAAEPAELAAHIRTATSRRPDLPFFDPRFLRTALPDLNSPLLDLVFGPVQTFLIESQLPHSMLQFQRTSTERGLDAQLHQFCRFRPRIPQQSDLSTVIAGRSAASAYPELAARYSSTSTEFDELAPLFSRHQIQRPEAQLQFAILRVALGPAYSSVTLERLLADPNRTPELGLDEYVTLLNEMRG